ncbi:hypothetical protein [Rubritalea profundi]|uniref:DUF4175 family protein n=1 Tax=Rubritalea profundi TaxID=1658618 RepID=A0A2S7U0Y3_9BACT|nr:hypothetical protein [Rubritalea profundi]PQJ27843.1 hypothetical protein BSZ32_04575 [Rubritalea profundi]
MPDTLQQKQLPESLRKQLKDFRGKVWRIKVLEAILAGFFGLFFSYVLVFGLDRMFPTPGFVRLIILIAGVSFFAVFAPIWINRWVFKHRRENQIAHLIAKQYPSLGDRLLGVVELQNQDEHDTSLSPRLREAAMHEVAGEVKDRDLQNALPPSWLARWSLGLLALVAIAITAWTLTPKASWNAAQRWLMPLAEIERYTETKIDLSKLPQPYYVAHGEPFTLELDLTEDSNTPQMAKAREGIKPWEFSSLEGRTYTFDFPKILKRQEIELRVGDAYVTIEVSPVMRPSLEEISALLQYPEYLQLDDVVIDLSSGQATLVEGNTITIKGRSNRELSSASITLKVPNTTNESAAEKRLNLTVASNTFTAAPISIGLEQTHLTLDWVDLYQLKNLTPTKLTIDAQVDAAPSAYIQNIANEIYVLADSAIEFEILTEDDFGIKRAGIDWQGSFTKPTPHSPAKGNLDLIQGNPTLRNAAEPIIFSFQAYDIRPQKLIIRAWSEDYKPGRVRSYSAPITVYVLTKQEHRELIEQRTQSAISKLEDIMRAEQDTLDENTRLERKSGEELQQQENKEKLAEQADKEKENADTMKELSKEMEEIFKDAAKNGEIDPGTMKKLAESAMEMKEMAEKSMPDIAKKLTDAQSPENTDQKAKEDVKEAVEKQNELLKKMEETIEKANEANKQLEAGTFINRLRKAAADEEELANTMIEASKHPNPDRLVLSQEFEAIDPVDQRIMLGLYVLQEQTASDIRWIQDDLGHFFSRTQQAEHKGLLDKMRDSNIDSDMAKLLRDIEQNHNITAWTDAKTAAKILRKWASALQDAAAKEDDAGGGGGGGGGGGSEDEDFEFMLKVMELIQKEQNIRANNRSLEQKRRLLKSSGNTNGSQPPRQEKLKPQPIQ